MSTGIVIFARMSSRRLPGKALLAIGSRPLLGHVIDRARRVTSAQGLVLATSVDASDDSLAAFAESEGLPVHRGPLDDVLTRAIECVRAQRWTAFARVCGDRPFLEPLAIDHAIQRIDTPGEDAPDLVTNMIDRAVPAGMTTEVIRSNALEYVQTRTTDAFYREHLTRYFYDHPREFRIADVGAPPVETEGLRLVVDSAEDLDRARYVVAQLPDPAAATLPAVAGHARTWDRKSET